MAKPLIVILDRAGMSEEKGLSTFRGADGLWEGYDITEVASPEGWELIRRWSTRFTMHAESTF